MSARLFVFQLASRSIGEEFCQLRNKLSLLRLRRRDTQSFGFDDLLVVAKLMYDAHSYINAQRSKDYAATKASRPVS